MSHYISFHSYLLYFLILCSILCYVLLCLQSSLFMLNFIVFLEYSISRYISQHYQCCVAIDFTARQHSTTAYYMFDTVCYFELSLYILLFFLIFSTIFIFIFISRTFFLVSSTLYFHFPFRCSFCSNNSTRWLKSSWRSYRIGCYERCSLDLTFSLRDDISCFFVDIFL